MEISLKKTYLKKHRKAQKTGTRLSLQIRKLNTEGAQPWEFSFL